MGLSNLQTLIETLMHHPNVERKLSGNRKCRLASGSKTIRTEIE